MGKIEATGNLREASIEAVVIRADGTRENLGVVAYYHRNPLKRAVHSLREKLNGLRNERKAA